MSRIEQILKEYVAFVELHPDTQREIVRRLEEVVREERENARHGR